MKTHILLLTVFIWHLSFSQSIDYETDIQPIFTNSCMPCHGDNNPSAGLNLTSYENLMNGSNSGPVIVVGDYQNSILWQEVESGDMPNNTANNFMGILDLTTQEVQLISDWIVELATTSIENVENKKKEIVKIFNVVGKEVANRSQEKILIYLYNDNSISKEYRLQ